MAAHFFCDNKGKRHEHETYRELMLCIGSDDLDLHITVRPRPAVPAATPASTPSVPAGGVTIRRPDDPPSIAQLEFIRNLGGSWRDAKVDLNKAGASGLIDILKDSSKAGPFIPPTVGSLDDDAWDAFPQERAWRKGELGPEWENPKGEVVKLEPGVAPVTDIYGNFVPTKVKSQSKLETALPLLARVPDGYYAPFLDEKFKLNFFRLSRPKRGKYMGCTKIQKVIGDRLEDIWMLWPDGTISIYSNWEDDILAIIVDYSGAARRYAKEKRKCCRCNTNLTDERSRKYGIGPECEKYWPWIIDEVDLELATQKGV